MPKLPITSAPELRPEIARLDVLLARAREALLGARNLEAIQLYRRCLKVDPTNLEALNGLGTAAGEYGDLPTAAEQFDKSLRIDPEQPLIWLNRAILQSRLGLLHDAVSSIDRALALSRFDGAGYLLRGTTLSRVGRYQDALVSFDEAARLLPNDSLVAKQRGIALQWCGQFEASLREFDRAIALKDDHAEAWMSKAFLLMTLGDLKAGLPLYEWRWLTHGWLESPLRFQRQSTQPLWLGETDIAGKTLLVYPEQGYGDTFQFCRYASVAANAGARVIVEAEPSLMALMATLPGVSGTTSDREPYPDHDLRSPMMSLPLAFGTTMETIPAEVPYLRADPIRVSDWRERLSGLRGRRIGLVWGAGARIGDAEMVSIEQRKSLPLVALAPLADVAGCDFVSIQYGPALKQAAAPPAGMVLHDYSRHIKNFADTAALMENLDLVISVCTSTAHLAGALARPVWLLNRFDTDWRWFLDRDDSPWYPSMRIFRQPRSGDWASVVRSVADALHGYVAA
jgi:tetratricopeptide (TPR) repeat protein